MFNICNFLNIQFFLQQITKDTFYLPKQHSSLKIKEGCVKHEEDDAQHEEGDVQYHFIL